MCPILGKKSKTESQVELLMKIFEANPYPGIKEKLQLAKLLNISEKEIENWFRSIRERKSKQGIMKKPCKWVMVSNVQVLSLYSTYKCCTSRMYRKGTIFGGV